MSTVENETQEVEQPAPELDGTVPLDALTPEQEQIIDKVEADHEAEHSADPPKDTSLGDDVSAPVEEAVEPEAQAAPVDEEVVQPVVDDALVERAVREFGWKMADAKAFGTSEQLQRAMDLSARTLEAARPPEHVAEDQRQEQDILEQLAALEPLDEEGFDESYIERDNLLRSVIQRQGEELRELGDFVRHSQARQQQGAEAEFAEHFDKVLLADEETDLFGEGGIGSLESGSTEADNRKAVFRQAQVLAAGLQQTGQPVPELSELVAQAKGVVFREHYQQQARTASLDKLQAQSKRRTGTPTRAAPLETGTPPPVGDPIEDPVLKAAYESWRAEEGE